MIVGLPKIHYTMKPMKTMRSAVLLGSVLSAVASGFASAGESYPPAPVSSEPASMWNWFIGASGGVQGDDTEAFWSGHVGVEKIYGRNSHALFLDVGFTELSEDSRNDGPPFVISEPGGQPIGVLTGDKLVMDVDIVPVTLNYKYEYAITPCIGWYIGAGAGVAFTDSEVRNHTSGTKIGDDSDEVFYAQAFTGITWNVTEQFEIFGGARYYYLDSIDVGDSNLDVGDSQDDWILEAGVRFNF